MTRQLSFERANYKFTPQTTSVIGWDCPERINCSYKSYAIVLYIVCCELSYDLGRKECLYSLMTTTTENCHQAISWWTMTIFHVCLDYSLKKII